MSDKKRVLLIEDEAAIAKLYQRHLEANFEVKLATNKQEVDSALDEEPRDFIFLDLEIPGTNGLEILRELRKRDQWKSVPVVVVSNMANPEVEEFALGLGAKEFIQKMDLVEEKLVELVEKYVK